MTRRLKRVIIVKFIGDNKRLPSRSKTDESSLEMFIKGNKRNYKNNKLSEDNIKNGQN